MTDRTMIAALRDGWRRFCRAERGNVVITFGLAFIPIVGLTGAAVDYTRANAVRTAMQSAADSTALAIAKTAAAQSASQLQSDAENFFNATFDRKEVKSVQVAATYSTTDGTSVTVNANSTMKTQFMGVMGISQMPLAVTSTAAWGSTRLRVALALDNTGSMASNNKMSALKTASKNLIAQLKEAATKDGDVYVSIIPFSKDVNVGGALNYNQNWIDWDDWNDRNGTCSKSSTSSKSNCQKNGGTWTPADHNTWNGCITDRDKDYDVSNAAPVLTDTKTLFPAEQYNNCPAELMPLSYNWTQLNNKIDAMTPNGNTNVTIGLVWGWHSLSQGSPLAAPPEDPKYQYQKVIILLTDGENTQNRYTSNQSDIDDRTKKACAAAKTAGITIFTVLVMEGTQSLLKQCASDAGKYFYLTSASQLVTAFEQIGTNLTKLRVAK